MILEAYSMHLESLILNLQPWTASPVDWHEWRILFDVSFSRHRLSDRSPLDCMNVPVKRQLSVTITLPNAYRLGRDHPGSTLGVPSYAGSSLIPPAGLR